MWSVLGMVAATSDASKRNERYHQQARKCVVIDEPAQSCMILCWDGDSNSEIRQLKGRKIPAKECSFEREPRLEEVGVEVVKL